MLSETGRTAVYTMVDEKFWDQQKLEEVHRVQRGQRAFIFISVVSLENADNQPVCKVICHGCSAEGVNAEMFLNPYWRDRVRLMRASTLREGI